VATSLNGKDSILDQHPLALGLVGSYGRRSANEAVADADLVMFVGSRAGGMTTENWTAPRLGAAVIQVDIEPVTVGLNYPVTVGVVGDARDTLRTMLAISTPDPRLHLAWQRRCQESILAWRDEVGPHSLSTSMPIRPARLCRELQSWLPGDGVLVADTGHIAQWSGALLGLTRPGQRYLRCAGTLGWALPGSIGVKCALPDRPVVCLIGDRGIYYHLAELETASSQGINVIVVVNNNGGLIQTRPDYDLAHPDPGYRRDELWKYQDVDFAAIARQLGCEGIEVHRPSELPVAMDRALAVGRPAVVDVPTDPTALPPLARHRAPAPSPRTQ
jgi:acetolactate synthase I/II/III large subunit